MTSANNGNGFSCDPVGAEATISCPCCGGTLTPQMIDQILAAARRPREEATPVTALGTGAMIIDPHAHMISRTTDDYEAMARAGVVAVIEPAFWLGQPRTNVGTYRRLSVAHHRLRALPRRPVRHPPLLHHRAQPEGGE